MLTFLITILFLVLASAGVYFGARFLGSKNLKESAQDTTSLRSDITELDTAIDTAATILEDMVSLDDKVTLEKEKTDFQTNIEEQRAKTEALQIKLEESQKNVAAAEAKLDELKRGKEESFTLAAEIRSNSEQLEAERSKLEAELNNSKTQMKELQSELELTAAQVAALDEIYSTIDDVGQNMTNLSQSHQLATDRFLNLQTQYEELEKEYAKLIEKELSPNE